MMSQNNQGAAVQDTNKDHRASHAELTLRIEGLVTPAEEHKVQTILEGIDGLTARVSYEKQTIDVAFDRSCCRLAEVVRRLDRLGVRIKTPSDEDHHRSDTPHAQNKAAVQPWLKDALRQPELVSCLIGGVLLVAGATVHVLHGPGWLRVVLLAASYITCGWSTAIDVVKTLGRLRFDIDVLMFLAAFGAAVLGHYEEGALLLLLFGLGGAGQRLAMTRARGAIKALTAMAPRTATLIDEAKGQREVRVEDLVIGDLVLIRPGQLVPADGQVVGGRSVIDQSLITGESVPVDKQLADQVFAGSINGDGALTIEVQKLSDENTIAKVIRLVEEAQASQSPTQLFTKQVERWYVPFVMITTGLLIVFPPLVGIEPTRGGGLWGGWFYQSMAFLTAASPCALAIGTPAAVLSGIGRAARAGVLIKGGAYLEVLGRVRAIAFDKTGTLTMGRHRVAEVVCLHDDTTEQKILSISAALENRSSHPLASAVVAEAESRQCPTLVANGIEQIPGMGVKGQVDHMDVVVGRQSLIQEQLSMSPDDAKSQEVDQRIQQLQSHGMTVIVVAVQGRVEGLIGLIDQPRETASQMIEALKKTGIRRMIMLTGDNEQTAALVAGQVGIDEWRSGLLPQQKVDCVKQLNERFGLVAMVGDGVNDAPALATAAVGVAMGGATGSGSDVALETADVALLAGDLMKVPQSIGISRFARRIIIQNLVIAMGVICFLAPLAALGFTTIYAAVLFHEGSTVLVVINGLRILRYRHPSE